MQADAVSRYHWMTGAQFLNAVALGQVTPGPVVQTVAVVGYAAAGLAGGLLASAVAFTPSFLIVLLGGPRFQRIRSNQRARAFLDGAGPAAIGAILGSAVTLTRELDPSLAVRGAGRRPGDCCCRCAAASSSPCCRPPRSASPSPWPRAPSPPDQPDAWARRRRASRAGPAVMPGPRGARFPLLVPLSAGPSGYWTTDQTKVALPETPSVSVAVTVTV